MRRLIPIFTLFALIFMSAGLAAQGADCDPPQIICPTTPFELTMCGPGEVCVDLPVIISSSPVSLVVNDGAVEVTADKRGGSSFCYPVETSGTYEFTLFAQNECGADTCIITAIVTINEPPVIECPQTVYQTTICGPGQVCMNLPITDAEMVQVSNGIWIDDMFCFEADMAGTYVFVISAANGCGAVQCEFSCEVEIMSTPVIDCPLIELSETICIPQTICVDLPITGADDVTVTGNGAWSEDQLCFYADTNGFYQYTVSATNYCGTVDCVVSINVHLLEVPQIGCPPEDLYFTLCELGTMGIYIPVGGEAQVTVNNGYWQNDTLYYDVEEAGGVNFQIIASNECWADTCEFFANFDLGTVPEISCPEDTFEYMLCEPGTICIDLPIDNPGTVTANFGAVWNDGLLCFEPSFPDQGGSYSEYNMRVIAEDYCGADTCSFLIIVRTTPPPMLCCPEADLFMMTECAGTIIRIPVPAVYYDSIVVVGGEYEDDNVIFVADSTQMRQIVIYAYNACGYDSCAFRIDLTVINHPQPDFSIDSTSHGVTPVMVYFSNDTEISGDMTFMWDFGDGTTSDEFDAAHAYDTNGCYDISLTATNMCGTATLTKYEYVLITDAQIVTPTTEWISIYCEAPMLDDEPLLPGDIISVYDPDGILCGMGMVKENGQYGFLTVYRDDDTTPDMDEGADPGDALYFAINFIPVYASPAVIWNENGDRVEVCEFSTGKCSEFSITDGWTLISWNVDYQAGIEDFINNILGGTECIDVILGFDQGALTYNPALPQFSTLNYVDYYHGYWIKGKCMTFAPLTICGAGIDPNDYINVYQGWNLVGYWPDMCYSTEEGFQSIIDYLLVALGYTGAGLTWLPDMDSYNTLTELCPGLGYWVKVSANLALAYPGFGQGGGTFLASLSSGNAYNQDLTPSRSWINLYGENITLDGERLESGTQITVVSEEGIVCGQAVYNGEILKFTPVYGFDSSNPTTSQYPREGEILNILINGVQVNNQLTWTATGDCVDISGLVTKPSGSSPAIPDKFSLSQNYPNPFNPTTHIGFALAAPGQVELSVYNLLGQKVTTLVDGYYSAGEYEAIWYGTDDGNNKVSSGVYLYRLKAGDYVETRKMILTK